jgi:hypothetical protein
MVKEEDMYTVYFLARKNKRRSEDAVIFELDYECRIKNLVSAINEKTYRSNANYTFIARRPKPREVFACELESRLIQWYIIWRINPILETILTSRTFNNRVGMGVDSAIAQIQKDIKDVSQDFTIDAYYIQWDLSGYFPNAICEIAREQLQNVCEKNYTGDDKEDIMWMISIACNALPARHCYRKSPPEMWSEIEQGKSLFEKDDGTGGAIGFLIWQVAMNLYLNDVDKWAIEDMGLHYVRFVDDTIIVVNNKEAALLLLPLFREKYRDVGAQMHKKKFVCQHISKGVRVLGSIIKFNRLYINNRTIRNAEKRIKQFNKCHNKKNNMLNFQATINSYFGLLKNRTEFNNIVKLYNMIDKRWWRFFTMDWERMCIIANDEYKYNQIIKQNYYERN